MGLKLLTLARCSVTGGKVIIHATGERAKVKASFNGTRDVAYTLLFSDGRTIPIGWSPDNQGYLTEAGDEIEEVFSESSPVLLA